MSKYVAHVSLTNLWLLLAGHEEAASAWCNSFLLSLSPPPLSALSETPGSWDSWACLQNCYHIDVSLLHISHHAAAGPLKCCLGTSSGTSSGARPGNSSFASPTIITRFRALLRRMPCCSWLDGQQCSAHVFGTGVKLTQSVLSRLGLVCPCCFEL